jgi:hypothetical protein
MHADPLHDYDIASVMLRFCKGVVGWSWIAAILGYIEKARAKRESIKQSPESDARSNYQPLLTRLEHYANEAVLPFYLLHQTVIVILAFYVVQWQSGALLKFLVISLSALAITLLLYEFVIRRTRLTRFLFGMKQAVVLESRLC